MVERGRHKRIHKDSKPAGTELKAKGGLLLWVVLTVVLAGIPFSLGKYFELNFPDPYDSGGYVYSARHVLEGARIGVDTKPSAQPGTLLVNMLGVWLLGFSETGPKLIQMVLQAAALVLMFWAMYRLFGKPAASIAVIVTAVYLSAPLVAKFGNVKEQYMIACMVIGVSCFVLRQLGGRWWWALLAGASVVWAPLFKATGVSALAAIGLFVLIQPVARHRSLKQTGADIVLLLAGAVIGLAPVYLWLARAQAPVDYWPYSFVVKPITSMLARAPQTIQLKPSPPETAKLQTGVVAERPEKKTLWTKLLPAYVRQGWQMLEPKERKDVVLRWLRFYRLLILPIALALGAIAARLSRMVMRWIRKLQPDSRKDYDRFVLLFAVWWLLDMVFVWVSPRSYEQYYLPLNASAAMLGGYLIALYSDALKRTKIHKARWAAIGAVGLGCMIAMSWPIFFGTKTSPHSGARYRNPAIRWGYAQKLEQISRRRSQKLIGPWETAADYIRLHSEPTDKIYVWGWYPGIYVRAQRFSAAVKPVMMPRPDPRTFARLIAGLLAEFEHQPPKFIVDSRKRHIPMNRPPYELWPVMPKGFMGAKNAWFLPLNENIIARYDAGWADMLRDNFGEDEAERYKAMAPFRKFVMDNYRIVGLRDYGITRRGEVIHRMFGQHVLFELKAKRAGEAGNSPE